MHKIFDCVNGNAQIILFSDGTRIINKLNDQPLNLETPLSLDIKLTNKCNNNCTFCYEGSSKNGEIGSLDYNFMESLPSCCEYNIGGGNICDVQALFMTFLNAIKKAGGICNTTINLSDFIEHAASFNGLQKLNLLHGLGVSYNREYALYDEMFESQIESYWTNNNIMHVINGLVDYDDLRLIKDVGVDKILILGMKNFGRGKTYLTSHNKEILENSKRLLTWLHEIHFDIVSYDNLALTQLGIKEKVNEKIWDSLYQGEDGTISFYIDLVEGKFAKNSIMPINKRYNIGDLSIKEMFNIIKNEQN